MIISLSANIYKSLHFTTFNSRHCHDQNVISRCMEIYDYGKLSGSANYESGTWILLNVPPDFKGGQDVRWTNWRVDPTKTSYWCLPLVNTLPLYHLYVIYSVPPPQFCCLQYTHPWRPESACKLHVHGKLSAIALFYHWSSRTHSQGNNQRCILKDE